MNSNIILWFEKLINYLEMTLHDKKKEDKLKYSFKINSLKKSLKVIREIDFEIKSGNDIKDYKSIGDGTIKRIDEILKTGRLDEVKDNNINLDELINVFGIGKKKALELYTKYNISTIKELKEAKIKLPDNILKGLEYVDKIKEKIPRKEIDKINLYLLECVRNIDKELNLIVCGSYRRENDFSNDIDIIITHPKIITKKDANNSKLMAKFIKYLEDDNFIVCSLVSQDVPTKYMGICKYKNGLFRRIDIRFIAQESYYTAIMYFTGSKEFNKHIRNVALSMNYTLNEYSLVDNKNNKTLKINNEKDIFKFLNLEYISPEKRNY